MELPCMWVGSCQSRILKHGVAVYVGRYSCQSRILKHGVAVYVGR